MNMQKYAKKKMLKYAQNTQIYAFVPWVYHKLYINCIYMQKYAKNMQKYRKYESMKIICIICTSHFADDRDGHGSSHIMAAETE